MKWSGTADRAEELSEAIPSRHHWFGLDEEGNLKVATSGEQPGDSARVFAILRDGTAEEILIQKTKHAFPRRAVFHSDIVIFIYADFAEAISLQTGQQVATRQSSSANLHEQTLLMVNGEIEITALPTSKYRQSFIARFPQSESGFKEALVIKPREISITEFAQIILRTDTDSYLFDLERLSWEKLRVSGKIKTHTQMLFKDTTKQRFPSEKSLQQATLLQGIIFTYDPRGLLHLTNGSSSWTLTLDQAPSSLWKSRDPNDLRPSTKEDFSTFLKNLNRTLNP